MDDAHRLLAETDTEYAHYEVWDTVYGGRPARVLYSGHRQTAQSGQAKDDNPHLLFDYNQRLLELAGGLRPQRLLLIGGGTYTWPQALLALLPNSEIEVVEIDDGLDAIAEQYFGLRPDPRLRIVHVDGRQYLNRSQERYDMIVLDAFLQAETPTSLTEVEALDLYREHLKPRGLWVRNVISAYDGTAATSLHSHLRDCQHVFANVTVYPASKVLPLNMAQNLLVIGRMGEPQLLDAYLRYPALR